MGKSKGGGKKGKQQRQKRASERQTVQEHGCQEAGCQSLDTSIYIRARGRASIRLCRACATRRGYCQVCNKKRELEEGTCAGCWAKLHLGLVKGEQVVTG